MNNLVALSLICDKLLNKKKEKSWFIFNFKYNSPNENLNASLKV